MFTQFYVIGPRGDSIIFRNFRNEIKKLTADTFFRNVRFYDGKTQEAPPIFNIDGLHYIWIKRNNIYFVLTCIENISPSYSIELLIRIVKLIKDYCGVLTEESIRSNFILVYEVLDEVFDMGYPQSTTNDTLKPYVFNEPITQHKLTESTLQQFTNVFSKTLTGSSADVPIGSDASSDLNRVYVDVSERLTYCVSAQGQLINQSIDGNIQLRSFLPIKTDLLLQFNEDLIIDKENNTTPVSPYTVELNSYNFHESIQHEHFTKHRSILVHPREGEVNIMNYHIIPTQIKLPFKIIPHLQLISPHKLELAVKIRSEYPMGVKASQVLLHIPVPTTTTTVSVDSKAQPIHPQETPPGDHSAEYDAKNGLVKWRLSKLPGSNEAILICRISLSEPHTPLVRREVGPINAMFEIPMYSMSGLEVKSLRPLSTVGEQPKRWIRYNTRSSSYVCRL